MLEVLPRYVAYAGNGVTSTFAITFGFFEIRVYIDGDLVDPANYTLDQEAPGDTSNITFITPPSTPNPPANGAVIEVVGYTEPKQTVDLQSGVQFNPTSVERQLDRFAMALQEFGLYGIEPARYPDSLLAVNADGEYELVNVLEFVDTLEPALDAAVAAAAAHAATASTQAGISTTQAGNASTSASAAAASALAAAASVAAMVGTSTTSLTIAVASKVFTTQSGKSFTAGRWVLITSDANPANYMHGQVTSYSGTTLTVNVTNIGGSGTLADWTITISGTRGAQGAEGSSGVAVLPGYHNGLELRYSTVAPNTEIDVEAGVTADDDDTVMLEYSGGTLDCTTTGADGLQSGSLGNNEWWHVFLITHADGSNAAVFASASPTAPTLPGIYTLFKRIGAFKTNGSAQIIPFDQYGDYTEWRSPPNNVAQANPGTDPILATLAVPTGVVVRAKVNATIQAHTDNARRILNITSPQQTAVAPAAFTAVRLTSNDGIGGNGATAADFEIWTNSSAQIRYELDGSSANVLVVVNTIGWFDLL